MTDSKTMKKKNYTIWLILAVAILPMASAYIVFFTGLGVPKHTVNAGRLLSPAQHIADLVGEDAMQAYAREKKWRLLLPVMAECDEACERNLYTSRQVHIRLAQKSERLERVAVLGEDQISEERLNTLALEHPRLKFVEVPSETWTTWLSNMALGAAAGEKLYFLVDQEGFAMMAYSSDVHGNDLLKDLKRALKFSIDYQ